MKPFKYIVISIADLDGILSPAGTSMLPSFTHSIDETQAIFCVNHLKERVAALFVDGFDYTLFLSKYTKINHLSAMELMNTSPWYLEPEK